MEREFGKKSFKPVAFNFVTIFSGLFNREYRNLFSRKLPGQILMSAYYTPMTIRELAIELGVASVYLEDEIAILEKYNIISKTPNGKYQTNIVIFTEDFRTEFYKQGEKFINPALVEIISRVKGKLGEIKKLNGVCEKLPPDRFFWSLMWLIMRHGNEVFRNKYPEFHEDKLYENAEGTNYGTTADEFEGEFGCDSFVGYSGIDEKYYASAADFNVLPKSNRYFENVDRTAFKERLYKIISGEIQPEFMIITEA